ncbi:hypothetical protein NCZ17_02155 [Acinetobacter modestus]|uniref:hypothetical protein n=1 Tax=Acinetobacter modestus TaxID=1776740 RepID=UPI00202DF3B4|nr:hypothetical protein [Acinetobacter modestus]MCM1958175.1 hypothetical protein [Acinetobacter modestus]
MNKSIILSICFVAASAFAETDSGSASELTIGQAFEINQAKNAARQEDSEAHARRAAKELGLDYDKMTKPPEQASSVVNEADNQKQLQQVIASDPVLGKYALDPDFKEAVVDRKIDYLNYFLISTSILAIFLLGFFFGRKTVKNK